MRRLFNSGTLTPELHAHLSHSPCTKPASVLFPLAIVPPTAWVLLPKATLPLAHQHPATSTLQGALSYQALQLVAQVVLSSIRPPQLERALQKSRQCTAVIRLNLIALGARPS